MELIVSMVFGSVLYGTAIENSDTDIKAIGIPSVEDILSFNAKEKKFSFKTGSDIGKNSKDDIDLEIINIKKFLEDACNGQTYSFDMIHAPKDMCYKWSSSWEYIISNKDKFYSKNISAMLGYVMQQTAKYGQKGSRLNDAKSVIEWLNRQPFCYKIKECDLSTFPSGDSIKFIEATDRSQAMISVCGKCFELNSRVDYAKNIIQIFYDKYGERAKLASINEFVDWKACSHAARVAIEIKEIFTENNIIFPLRDAKTLLEIKQGQWEYKKFSEYLENLVSEVKDLKDKSSLPENVDREFWDNFLIDFIKSYLRGKII